MELLSIISGAYNEQYPIAKIENLQGSQIPPTLQGYIDASISAANLDDDRTIDIVNTNGTITYQGKEGLLRAALANLRNILSNTMISTYTYDPLVGVTSMTDTKGYVVYYQYDAFNRLEFVRDAKGKVLSQNEYHYKN